MPDTNHIIICASTTAALNEQAIVLLRAAFVPFGEPWGLGDLWCWTWLGPASESIMGRNAASEAAGNTPATSV
jgi:hypothetical protein